VIESYLKANGINTYISGGETSVIHPGIEPVVFVAASDRFKANALAREQDRLLPSDRGAAGIANARAPDRIPLYEIYCPTCGSHMLEAIAAPMPALLQRFGLKAPAGGRWYKCQMCGTEFDDSLDRSTHVGTGCLWALAVGGAVYGLIQLIIFLKTTTLIG